MTEQIINALKLRAVAAELKDIGVTDKSTVLAIAARTKVLEDGTIVGVSTDGSFGVGNGANYHLSVADVAHEMRANTTPPSRSMPAGIQGNPFRPGQDFSLTGQMILMKNDPVLAEDLAADAGVSLSRN